MTLKVDLKHEFTKAFRVVRYAFLSLCYCNISTGWMLLKLHSISFDRSDSATVEST